MKIGCNNIVKRSWNFFDKTRCLEKFKKGDWNKILSETDVDVANTLLEEEILKVIDEEAPLKTVQLRAHYNNWISDKTKMEMSRRDGLRDVARQTDDETDWRNYRVSRNLCSSLQKKDRSSYYKKMFDNIEVEKDAKKLFGNAKNLLGWTSAGPPSCFQVAGRTIRGQKELANEQIKFYENKVIEIKHSLPGVGQDPLRYLRLAFERWNPTNGKPNFKLEYTTISEVLENIKALKNSKAFGRDKIDAVTIKIAAPVIAPAIAHVINLSLGVGKFPQKWKLARIIPLQKSKTVDRLKPSSFRPVSLLPLISKLAERVVQKQILKYLENSRLLSSKQHAYRNRCSTTTALIQLMDIVATAADENKIAATMGLDQSTAFDCVEHETLKNKLRFYSLDRQTLKWIDSYLTGRSGFVAIGSRESNIKSTPYGVLQGSVLGPLLYLMYINELPMVAEDESCNEDAHIDPETLFGRDCSKCGSIPIFTDDSQYICVSKSREVNQLNIAKNFEKIRGFLNDNGLQINESKTSLTEYMTAQKRGRLRGSPPQLLVTERMEDKDAPGNFVLTDKTVSDSKSCRTLGMNTQNNPGWESHLVTGKSAILPAVRKQLGMLNRMSAILSMKAKLQLANCLIVSKITYGICLWGNSRGLALRKAQIILNETA